MLKTDYRLPIKYPRQFVFLTISGSHMFGFDSPDSDYDIRGIHIAKTADVLSLPMIGKVQATLSAEEEKAPGSEEMVTHEVEKFMSLMIKNGGNLIEQVLSPHVVQTSPIHVRLKELAPRVITKGHLRHYLGFSQSQIKLMNRRPDKETKIFLYIFRTLLSGIAAAREKVIESNLDVLCEHTQPDTAIYIRRVIEWKKQTQENNALYYEFSPTKLWMISDQLEYELKKELANSTLPETPPKETVNDFNELLLEIRANN